MLTQASTRRSQGGPAVRLPATPPRGCATARFAFPCSAHVRCAGLCPRHACLRCRLRPRQPSTTGLFSLSVLVPPALVTLQCFSSPTLPFSSAERAAARAKSARAPTRRDDNTLLIAVNAEEQFIVKNSACCARLCMLAGPRISLSCSLCAVPYPYTNPTQAIRWAQRAGFMWWSENKEWWLDLTGLDPTNDPRICNLVLAILPSCNIGSVQDLVPGLFYPASISRWASLEGLPPPSTLGSSFAHST